MSDQSDELLESIVDTHVADLAKSFDSVRVFVTKQTEGGTVTSCYDTGAGNFYASQGQVREWLICHDHRARLNVEKLEIEKQREGEES